MRLKAKFKGHWYKLLEGYDLKTEPKNRSGYVLHSRRLKHYIWTPKPKDLFYEPTTKTIYRFIDWNDKSPSGLTSELGFAKITKIKGGKSLWVDLEMVVKCVPVEKL